MPDNTRTTDTPELLPCPFYGSTAERMAEINRAREEALKESQ